MMCSMDDKSSQNHPPPLQHMQRFGVLVATARPSQNLRKLQKLRYVIPSVAEWGSKPNFPNFA